MKIHAAMIYHKIPETDVHGQIFTFGAEDAAHFCLIETNATKQVVVRTSGLNALKTYIREENIGLVIIDPLVSFFPGDMNANGIVGAVMLGLKRVAVETDSAMIVVQHVAKGTNADTHGAESASGAASAVNLARTAFGIMGVSEKDATSFGIMLTDAKHYFRLINTKANFAIKSDDLIFRRHAVPMDNGTEEFPEQDYVPVAVPHTVPEGGLIYPLAVLRDALSALDSGTEDGLPFSRATKSNRSFELPMATAFQAHYPDLNSPQLTQMAKAVVEKLISDGWVVNADVKIKKKTGGGGSNSGKGLVVRWGLTPWPTGILPDTVSSLV